MSAVFSSIASVWQSCSFFRMFIEIFLTIITTNESVFADSAGRIFDMFFEMLKKLSCTASSAKAGLCRIDIAFAYIMFL